MNTQNIQNELIKDEVINQELLDYSVDRSYIESHFNELSLIVIIISILFFRFNKNILKYLLNVILDVVLEVLVVFLYLKIFVIIEKFSLIGNGVFLETRDYVILFIISSIIIFVLSLIILAIKIKLLNKYFKYGGENNDFKNALFKEMLKFTLPLIIYNFCYYFFIIYYNFKNPVFNYFS